MRKLLATLSACYCLITTYAQDATIQELKNSTSKEIKSLDSSGWKKGGTFIINFNQGSLSNWAAGGEQSIVGINGIFNYTLNYKKDKNTWDNFIDLALGFQNASSFGKFRKIDDRIDLTSKYGRQMHEKLFAAILANFNSQALAGYDYSTDTKISNWLAPGKVLVSLGLDFRPNKELSIFISPITNRWILKNDNDFFDEDKFGVAAQTKTYNEIGAYMTAKYSKQIAPWIAYTGRLDLFSNYKRNPQNIDVFFTNLVALKFNKWLATTFSMDMIYDEDIISRIQLKQILGIGLTVKL
ncbi:MAG TPA: DUF3078 domain-containing protein [Ferruginibacter sp.]|nr:DUF3078 domain-containing protein [Ferruginibacter sp.]HMP21071.1 DUF3078 domain-containing protein [Ferruginibacter sp.]